MRGPRSWPVTLVAAAGPSAVAASAPWRAARPVAAVPQPMAGERPAINRLRPLLARQALGLRTGMAELVLLNRLRARTRRDVTVEVLEHAARVIEVSARSWLAEDGSATR